jgi:Glycosyl hydrolase family 12
LERLSGWGAGSILAIVLVALVPTILPSASLSNSTTRTCDPFGTVQIASGKYVFQQNEWNSSLTQCASVDPASGAWDISQASFDLSTNGPPATYPSIFRGCHWGDCTTGDDLPIKVGALTKATSSWSTVQPPTGAYDIAYDLWTNTTPVTSGQPDGSEIMVWLDSRGGVVPAGSRVARASIAGSTWDVWVARMSGWNYVAYQRTRGTGSVTGLNLRAFVRDSVARGRTDPSWYLIDAEAGSEIWQGGRGIATASFSFRAT